MRKPGTHNIRNNKSINRPHKEGADKNITTILELPDDVLIAIISCLTLREATATSILSRRWRYLHTYVTRLDFPTYTPDVGVSSSPSDEVNDLFNKSEERKFRNHVEMVDGVLDSHRGGVEMKELKLHMHRMKGASFEKWMQFALTKQIETIDISLVGVRNAALEPISCRYSLGLAKYLPLGEKSKLPCLKFLKQFVLCGIDMNDQDFDLLISNFDALESLTIGRGMHDYEFKKLSIVGHPNLKHVDICLFSLQSVEIRDVMNLVSLRFDELASGCVVEIENTPKLTRLHYVEHGHRNLAHHDLFATMSSCIRDQLQLLHLSTDDHFIAQTYFDQQPYEFANLKHLELEVKQMSNDIPARLFKLNHLICACPSLQKLKIKFDWWAFLSVPMDFEKREADVYSPYHRKLSPNLKELEVEGYVGTDAELKLASFIINYAANLEQVVVVACDQTEDIHQNATARAISDFQNLAPRRLVVIEITNYLF